MADKSDTQAILEKRFAELPKVVQNAITSTDVRKGMRALADTHKLHLDQWETLENEVMMTLFGVFPIDELQANIQKEVEVPEEIAKALTENISKIVFEPIRAELERELAQPSAQAAEAAAAPATPAAPAVLPATPPAEPPTAKIIRAPVSESYKAGEASTIRKSVHDDPYREPPA